MSIAEWFATFLSFGLYYFMTRIVLQRRRFYKVYVTNMNVIVKEEMTETSWGCLKLLLENQASFPISSLAFVTAEVIGQKLCGYLPASVVLEMRFGRYPVDSEYPTTMYRSLLAIAFSPFAHASKAAYKNVFGIDFDAPPVKLSVKLVKAIPLLSVPHMWILWGAAFAVDMVQQACHAAYLMMIAALLDPSVGPRQATGAKDACVFRLEADVSEDPECQAKMRRILDAITRQLPDRGIIDMGTVKPRLPWPMSVVPAGAPPRPINTKKRYGEENGFVVLEDYLSIPQDETIYDACPVNPHWTSSDVKRVIMSLGAYYITDMAGHIQHRTNMIFTNKRIIQHSVLVSSFGGACDHSRLDFWVNDDFVNMTAAEFKKRTTFRATAKNFGWLSFEIKKTSPFTMFVFRSLFRPLYRAPPGTPGLCSMTKEQWMSHNLFKGSILTSCALANSSTSIVDVAAHSDQEINSCLYSTCCCPKIPKTTITATDEALYIEDYREATCCKSAARVFVALPWSEVDGVYWQNFDAAGPNCMMAYILACVCPGLFGYYGCLCCCCSPNGAKENNPSFFDYIFGYKGATVAVCARGDNTFCLGMVIPGQFYGVHYNAQVNALVDSINFRCLLNDPKNAFIDTTRGPAAGAVLSVNGGGAGAAISSATGQIANMAQISQGLLSGRVDGAAALRQATVPLFSQAPNMNDINNQRAGPPSSTPVAVAVPVNSPIAAQDRGYNGSVDHANCPHWSMYQGQQCRQKPPTTGFPLNYDMSTGYVSLAAGEELVRGWKVETTHMEVWELVLAILTFGMSFLYHKLFIQRRRFYNIYITTDRVLVKEEVFEMRMWTVCRIMENQASFKLSDLCYISSQELGPQYCGCIPALTEISLRFGRYPHMSEVANSIDTLKGSPSDRNPWTVAVTEAAASAYGIYESGTPEAVMNNVIQAEQNPKSFLTEVLDLMCFSFVVTRSLIMQVVRFVIKACVSFFFSRMSTVGPAQVSGNADSRSFSILFKTRNASSLANDVVKTLTQAAACKHTPLVPSVKLDPIASPRFVKCEPGQLCEVNNTGKYGTDGGFVILQRMWDLLQGEVVYDVVPTNPRWSLTDRIMTVLTVGIYWLLYVRRKLQYKTSHMVTDHRLVTHTLRITWGTVRYSSLEMWLLAPVTSFTVAKTSVPCTNLLCRTRTTFEFVTDSTKFGVLRVSLRCEPFILNMLKIMTHNQPHRRLPNVVSMSRDEIAAIPEMKQADYTTKFLTGEEVVDVAIGSTLPRTCWQFLCCKQPMKFALTFTGNAVHVEAYDDRRRLFTSLSWELVTGTYWSNFQAHSDVCVWHNSAGFITPLHGFSGSQVRICVNAGRSFGIGITLPSRFYQALVADDHVNSFVTALSHRLLLATAPHLLQSTDSAAVPRPARGLTEVCVKSSDCGDVVESEIMSILQWAEGPFVFNISCKERKDLVKATVEIYDDENSLSAGTLEFGGQPLHLRRHLDDPHNIAVRFTLHPETQEPSYELQWIPFRGNSRLVPLGPEGSPLLVSHGDNVIQNTHGGHLFVAMLPESGEHICAHDEDAFSRLGCQISRVVGMYLVPAVHAHTMDIEIDPLRYPFNNIDAILELSNCPYRSRGQSEAHVSSFLRACFREVLMLYWEHQRLSQVWVNTWAVPVIPLAGPPHVPAKSTAQLSNLKGDIGIVGTSDVSEFIAFSPSSTDSTTSLWTVVKLPDELSAQLKRSCRTSLSVAEPPISLVFNQFDVRTYYTPLPAKLLDALVAQVHTATAQWLGLSRNHLKVSGAYGCREYRQGAVVRWHVDPADTQPLTAIIHIADSDGAQNKHPWAIEVPKDLTLFHNFTTTYSASTKFGHSGENMHKIYLAEGEMLLLQSAKVPHARVVPFEGEWYANAYVHFAPVGWADREDIRLLSG